MKRLLNIKITYCASFVKEDFVRTGFDGYCIEQHSGIVNWRIYTEAEHAVLLYPVVFWIVVLNFWPKGILFRRPEFVKGRL